MATTSNIESKKVETPEEQEQKKLEQKNLLQGVLSFNADSNDSKDFLSKTKGGDVVNAIKSDVSSRLSNVNDEESRKKIEETMKGFDTFAKKDKLNKEDIENIQKQFNIIDNELGQEGREGAKLGKDFQEKQNQEKKDYTKLTKAVESLNSIFEGWHKDKMAEKEKEQQKNIALRNENNVKTSEEGEKATENLNENLEKAFMG